jgi:hypothetical protein
VHHLMEISRGSGGLSEPDVTNVANSSFRISGDSSNAHCNDAGLEEALLRSASGTTLMASFENVTLSCTEDDPLSISPVHMCRFESLYQQLRSSCYDKTFLKLC